MRRSLSRRALLSVPATSIAGVGLAGATRANGIRETVFIDRFTTDSTDQYEWRREPVSNDGATSGGTATPSAGVTYDAGRETLDIRAPAGVETVVTPTDDMPVLRSGTVQLGVRVPRTHGDSYRFGVRLVESGERWLGFRAVADGETLGVFDSLEGGHAGGGTTVDAQGTAGSDYHVFSFVWSPSRRAWYVDGERRGEGGSPETGGSDDFAPTNVQLRARQCDVELNFWHLESETDGPTGTVEEPPPGTRTPSTPATPSPTDTVSTTGATGADHPTHTTGSGTTDWFDELALIAVTAGGIPVVGSIVLGGLLAASAFRTADEDGDE